MSFKPYMLCNKNFVENNILLNIIRCWTEYVLSKNISFKNMYMSDRPYTTYKTCKVYPTYMCSFRFCKKKYVAKGWLRHIIHANRHTYKRVIFKCFISQVDIYRLWGPWIPQTQPIQRPRIFFKKWCQKFNPLVLRPSSLARVRWTPVPRGAGSLRPCTHWQPMMNVCIIKSVCMYTPIHKGSGWY